IDRTHRRLRLGIDDRDQRTTEHGCEIDRCELLSYIRHFNRPFAACAAVTGQAMVSTRNGRPRSAWLPLPTATLPGRCHRWPADRIANVLGRQSVKLRTAELLKLART